MKKLLIGILLIISGCGIQSIQYDIMKNNIVNNEDDNKNQIPKPNWEILWDDRQERVYAINNESSVFFANEDILVHFDGWNIVQVKGLGENFEDITIVDNQKTLSFYEGGNLIDNLICEDWKKTTTDNKFFYKRWCQKEGHSYENFFQLNEKNELIYLNFSILPSESPVKIYLNQ